MPALHLPLVTSLAAGLLGLVFLTLSARVVMGRMAGRVMLGNGEESETSPLFVAIRGHANFAEYVPICLILIGAVEMRSGPTLLVKGLAAVLVLARLAHPIGLVMAAPNPLRAGGFAGTMLVILVASITLLVSTVG